jgi:uncharacterized protein (DUF1330 family)
VTRRVAGVLAVGAGLLAAGVFTMNEAAASPPAGPGYLVVIGKGTDRERMMAYSRALPPVYAKAGGRYLAIGGPGRGVEWLDGPWRDRSLVLARFDGLPQAQAFWWGEDYRQAVRLRDAAGQFTVVAVPGAAPDAGAPAGAYLVVATVTRDAEAYAEYRRAFEALLAAHGGRVLAGGDAGAYVALEGDPLYDRVAIAAFPSRAAQDAFLADPRAAEVAALRGRAGLALVARADAAAAPSPSVTQPGAPPAGGPPGTAPPGR